MNLIDYHTHTELCGHASGTIDEYVIEAIKKNLKEIGFSDHAPLPEGKREGITMLPEETEKYIELVESKIEQYKDKIEVKVGFEIDFPLMDSFDRKYLTDARLDYLIGSCHFLGDWAFDHPDNIHEFSKRDIDRIYSEYYGIMHDLINTGYFNIIGHFDIVKKFGHRARRDFTNQLEKLAQHIAKQKNLAVEINTAGIRKPVQEMYPSDDVIRIFYNANAPITLGSDSHKPEEVGYLFDKAVEKAKKAGYRKVSGFSKRIRYDIAL
ncbi:MAG: histidinol-phosphatase HisJ family protein [Spirochaetota bacterium]